MKLAGQLRLFIDHQPFIHDAMQLNPLSNFDNPVNDMPIILHDFLQHKLNQRYSDRSTIPRKQNWRTLGKNKKYR